MRVDDEFARLAHPFRGELLAHCYRMCGSVHDAEDLVQETLLRAWRSYDRFEERSSLRTWLHRIATRVCLTALQHRERRVLPAGLGGPSDDPGGPLGGRLPESLWVQPFPDRLLAHDAMAADPADIVGQRARMRLAVVAAMQHLPSRQRAALIMRDVLDMPADEIADVLGTSPAAANSALQRARATMARLAPDEDDPVAVGALDPAILDRYVEAFESADIAAITRLLTDDVQLQMPPIPTWFEGRRDVARFFAERVVPTAVRRFRPTRANGQLAAVSYVMRDGVLHAHGVQVLTTRSGMISRLDVFLSPELLPLFGFPPTAS